MLLCRRHLPDSAGLISPYTSSTLLAKYFHVVLVPNAFKTKLIPIYNIRISISICQKNHYTNFENKFLFYFLAKTSSWIKHDRDSKV